MSATLTLSRDELADLTGKLRSDAQAKVLDFMGIPYRSRPDGTLAVLRIHVEIGFEAGGSIATSKSRPEPEVLP